jgi:hypothetical protein
MISALEGGGRSAPCLGCFTPGKDPVPIVQEAGWAPGPVWTWEKILAPTGIRSLDCPAHSQPLYWLSHRAHLPHIHSCNLTFNLLQIPLLQEVNIPAPKDLKTCKFPPIHHHCILTNFLPYTVTVYSQIPPTHHHCILTNSSHTPSLYTHKFLPHTITVYSQIPPTHHHHILTNSSHTPSLYTHKFLPHTITVYSQIPPTHHHHILINFLPYTVTVY